MYMKAVSKSDGRSYLAAILLTVEDDEIHSRMVVSTKVSLMAHAFINFKMVLINHTILSNIYMCFQHRWRSITVTTSRKTFSNSVDIPLIRSDIQGVLMRHFCWSCNIARSIRISTRGLYYDTVIVVNLLFNYGHQ